MRPTRVVERHGHRHRRVVRVGADPVTAERVAENRDIRPVGQLNNLP